MFSRLKNKSWVAILIGGAVAILGMCACAFVIVVLLGIVSDRSAPEDNAYTPPETSPAESHDVIINEVRLDDASLRLLANQYELMIEDGAYWYDSLSGAWGYEGGPTVGFILPNLGIGGSLKADASGGNTQIFLNGRELPQQDVWALEAILGYINPGRYSLDAFGNMGYEGEYPLVNIIQLQYAAASSGTGNYNEGSYGGYSGGNDEYYFYDSSSGCSVMSDGGLSC